MQTALRLKTKVSATGKLEIFAPELPFGEMVEVIILLPPKYHLKRSVMDILAQSTGQRLFKTVADVDNYVMSEHEAWDNVFNEECHV